MRAALRRLAVPLLLCVTAACADDATRATLPDPQPAPLPLGVYEIAVTGIGGEEMQSSVRPAKAAPGGGPSRVLTVAGAGIEFEQVASSSFTEGTRTGGGQRYVSFTYRVRNGTGGAINNLTMLMVSRAGTIAGTPLSSLKRFDGADADPAIARYVVPTGSVGMRSDLVTLQAPDPDVIQVLSESEVSSIPPPGDVTNIFPYGYVVRHATSTTTRTLPPATAANQYDGVLTLSFRLPLQATSSGDVFSLVFQVLAIRDSQTRMTESMEEAQDTGAVRRLRERAASLGATTVTILGGSTAAAAEVPDYPGQRQICSVRTAGTAASPLTYLNTPAGYTRLEMYFPGENASSCGANFLAGTASRPTLNAPYVVNVRAMDRYGNVIPGAADTVTLTQTSGPGATFGPTAALSGGQASLSATWQANGTSQLNAVGRRLRGRRAVEVATSATVALNGGNNQAAMAGQPVPVAPSVVVRDLAGNPLSGVPVTFAVTGGGGYVTAGTAVTDGSGVATVGSWVMGSPAAVNALTATAAGASAPVSFTAVGCSGGGGTAYNITLCFVTPVTATQRAAFESAAARWQQVVTGDVPDVALSMGAGTCGDASPGFDLSVDDLLIFVSLENLDGLGNFLGFANWCYRRAAGLPLVGWMRFDAADMPSMESNGLLGPVIRHEMGHVLGIGTLWTQLGLLQNPSPVGGPALDTWFSGSQGIAGFNSIGGSSYTGGQKVPVQNTGPAGTINQHWREGLLQTELMTASINVGSNPLSLLTVRSLADLGYTVNTSAADPVYYGLSARAGDPAPDAVPLGGDVMAIPQYTVDTQGRATRIR